MGLSGARASEALIRQDTVVLQPQRCRQRLHVGLSFRHGGGNVRDDLTKSCNLGDQMQIYRSLKWYKCRKHIFGTRCSSVDIESPASASKSCMDDASYSSSLACPGQFAAMGNHCPEGCACDASREKACSLWTEVSHAY